MKSRNIYFYICLLVIALTGITACTIQDSPTAVPSSAVVLFARDDDLWRSDSSGNHVEQLTSGKTLKWGMDKGGDEEWRLVWPDRPAQVSPDGKWIAAGYTGITIPLIAVDQREEIRTIKPGALSVSWSPNSQYLAFTPDYEQLYVYDVQKDTVSQLLEDDEVSDISNIVWAPDSRHIAFGCCFKYEDPNSTAENGQIKTVDIFTNHVADGGETWRSIGGGSPALCWTSSDNVALFDNTDQHDFCSYLPLYYHALSADGQREAFIQYELPEDGGSTGLRSLTVRNGSGDVVWEHQLEEDLWGVTWSADDQFILLDDNSQSHSPIWRTKADGSSGLEIVVEDGFLIDVIPGWQ